MMKTSITVLISTAAALVAAQSITFPSGFPDCASWCIDSMNKKGSTLGCPGGEASCLCANRDYIFGVRDCASGYCQNADQAKTALEFGVNYCASAGVQVAGFSTADGAPSATTTIDIGGTAVPPKSSGGADNSGVPVSTSDILSTVTNSDGSAVTTTIGSSVIPAPTETNSGTDGAGGVIPISTQSNPTTITSDGATVTSDVAVSTIFSSGSATESAPGSGSASVTTGVTESSIVTNGSTLATSVTTTGEAATGAATTEAAPSETSEGGSETTEGNSEGATSTPAPNPAAQHTPAPAGLIGAAALAALML